MKRLLLLLLALMLLASTTAMAATYGIGDTVFYGSYEQDNDASDGREPIEWIVLDKKADGSYLLISRYALDCKPYKSAGTKINWADSLLRTWLNEEFYVRAFTAEEQKNIATTWVIADNADVPEYDAGEDTMDKVFVLGWTEGLTYLSDKEYEQCVPTQFAIANGVKQNETEKIDGTGVCWYWLRSPNPDHVAYMGAGAGVDTKAMGVRPAIWAFLEP